MENDSVRQGAVRVRTRLQEIRKARGLAAADLARRVGVSRQTIYAIEDGSFVPNTAVSLQLSRALECTVEAIFSLGEEQAPEPIRADLLPGGEAREGQLVRMCRVHDRIVAIPVSAMPAYLPPADGIIESRGSAAVSVKSPAVLEDDGKRLLIAGCDPALSLLRDGLHASGIDLVSVPSPSRRALKWLKEGRVHGAGSHLLDRATGDYNVPIVRRLLPDERLRVVTFAVWEQGLVMAHGNPKGIQTVADLAEHRVTLINREKGAGSRDLLDHRLSKAGIRGEHVRGYDSIAEGHLAAAYAVATGGADCCVAPRSAARCFGLDFIPLAVERFDLSFTAPSLELPSAKALLDLLNRSTFRKRLECLAGYDTAHTGEVLV